MSATVSKTCDVFLSYAASDRNVAAEVAEAFESSGLTTFRTETVAPGADLGDAIWDALAESRALVAIVSSDMPAHAMGMIELGAATAWNKPVFLLISEPSTTKLPPTLSKYPAYPLNRLDDVARAVQEGFEPLTNDERSVLVAVYAEMGVSVDQLAVSSKELRALTTRFNRKTRRQFTGERLLSEVLRLRKQGLLPRLRTRKLVPE